MKKNLFILAIALIGCATTLSAQSRKAVRINEVMVQNNSSIVDEYGNREGWIELFNGNFAPIEISSVYLTTDSTIPTMYPVPLGDEKTKLGKRQHIIFYADGEPERGTFHTNFKLVPGQDNWIGLYDADGKTLIDAIVVPASIGPDQTFARATDGASTWELRDGSQSYITPSGANKIKDSNDKIKIFAEIDGHGFGMAAMAMCIVFSSLLVLCLAFMAISKIGDNLSRRNKAKSQTTAAATVSHTEVEHDSGEEIAAICMALYEHFDVHDQESSIITINKVKRAYSPWSSKIYGLRQMPNK